jgi:predicted CXXCH cytochrome family protein
MNRTVGRLIVLACVAVMAVFVVAAPALAYDFTNNYPDTGCYNPDLGCHYEGTGSGNPDGPHGTFNSNTNGCRICHWTHEAPGSYKLTVGDSLTQTCMACHDQTGGGASYGLIEGKGDTVEAAHSVDTTNVVPGGDPNTGGPASYTFVGPDGTLSCGDCHSPHGTNLVNAYRGERVRHWLALSAIRLSTKLLRNRPNGATYDIDEYGSDWCLACHRGRGVGGAVHNHPVETTATPDYFYYARASILVTAGSSETTIAERRWVGRRSNVHNASSASKA